MKTIFTSLLIFLFLQSIYAQKTRVYDGEGLNIKFVDSDSDKIHEIMFTGKDANGKLVWKKTQLMDISAIKFEDKAGYKYLLKDADNIPHELKFNSSMDRIQVDKLDKNGKRVLSWLLYERKEKQVNNSNQVKMTYAGSLDIKFIYDKKTELLSNIQSFYSGEGTENPAYRTLKIVENEGGLGGEMYCIATYKDHEYVLVYQPDNMNSIEVTLYYDKNKKVSKEFKLKRKN